MTAPQFCPDCGVTLDLHDGPDSCDLADAKARLLEEFSFIFGGAR
jgi:hypothetical protein